MVDLKVNRKLFGVFIIIILLSLIFFKKILVIFENIGLHVFCFCKMYA